MLLPIPMFIIEPDPEGQAEEQGQGDMLWIKVTGISDPMAPVIVLMALNST